MPGSGTRPAAPGSLCGAPSPTWSHRIICSITTCAGRSRSSRPTSSCRLCCCRSAGRCCWRFPSGPGRPPPAGGAVVLGDGAAGLSAIPTPKARRVAARGGRRAAGAGVGGDLSSAGAHPAGLDHIENWYLLAFARWQEPTVMYIVTSFAVAWAILALGICLFFRRRGDSFFWAAVALACVALMTGLVPWFWQLPELAKVQFPWRLLVVVD